MHQQAIKKKRKALLFVWILPLIAIVIASWMLFKHYSQSGGEITVIFNNADGFIVGKTPLKYKGIKVGVISDIDVDKNNINHFLVKLQLYKDVKEILGREGSMFWKVEPKVTLSEVSGLNTILSGIYIEAIPQYDNVEEILKQPVKERFEATNQYPIVLSKKEGLFLTLKSNRGNISINAPLLFKNFIVGKVLQKELQGHEVVYKIFIKNEYKHLIKEDSQFWNVSGVEVNASLSGIKMNVESLESLVTGGIAFSSNKDAKALSTYEKVYKLYDSKEDVGFSEEKIVLHSKELYKLEKEFSKVYYQGMVVGKVTDIIFEPTKKRSKILLKLKEEYLDLLHYKPYFQVIKPEISFKKISGLSSIVKSNYIQLSIDSTKQTDVKQSYTLHDKDKTISMYTMMLYTTENTNITEGSPIFYKNVKVGFVEYKRLDKKNNRLKIKARIYWIHRNLINDTSVFYEQSPIEFKASLKEVYLKTGSLNSFINSGLAFETFDLSASSKKKSFELYKNYTQMKEAKYLLQEGKFYNLKVRDVSVLKENELIYYQGIEAGKVLYSYYEEKSKVIYYKIFVLNAYAKLMNESTKFYSISGLDMDLSLNKINVKTKSLDTLINGGISFFIANHKAPKVNSEYIFDFYKSLNEAKEEYVYAKVNMSRGYDLKEGSKVIYKDLTIGRIENLSFIKNDRVQALIRIQKRHVNLLNKDTLFYLDAFKFSLSNMENPSGALLGSNIKVIAGNSNVKQKVFELITYKPFEEFDKKGLRVIVNAKLKSSLKQNSPVFYRQLQIGVVEKYALSEDSTYVKLQLFIEEQYAHLVRKNSIFYNAGALGVDLYLFGVKIKTETLETLISGGISLVTPTQYNEKAKMYEEFELEEDLDEDWLDWQPKLVKE